MVQKINEPVSVSFSFDSNLGKLYPKSIIWKGHLYPIVKLGFHHTYRRGRDLFHVFSVIGKSMFFRLVLNTENLHWRLEEVSDGLPD
jgi:hypothetical protein